MGRVKDRSAAENDLIEEDEKRGWKVLVIGGGAAVGKTTTAKAVAARYGVSVLPVDTIWWALKAATNPASHPEVHYFDPSDEEMVGLTDEDLCERHIKSARAISQAMDPVIEFYRYERWPVIVEGAWITPAAAARWSRQYEGMRAVFIHEPDMNEVLAAMAARSGWQDPTPRRKRLPEVCSLFGNWVREQALADGPCGP